MKGYFKTPLLLSFGIVSLATALNVAPRLNAATATTGSCSKLDREVTQTEESPLGKETLLVQATGGNALAASLQGRPTIVKIYADWCPACQRLLPITDSLRQQFNGRANFVIFDVTDRSTTQAAEAQARELGLSNFFAANRAQTATVAIIDPSTGQILRQFRSNFNQQDYANAINQAIAQVSTNP